ncbi:hypothetical protein L6R50_15290 [Myxococcota bacterium]|nr:hypothetical protein [Myxococcota bacterium]
MSRPIPASPTALLAAAALLPVAACDANGLRLLQNFDGGEVLESDLQDLDQADPPPGVQPMDGAEPFIGELGPTNNGSAYSGGATASFLGTGGPVCVVLDPQTVWRDDQTLSGGLDPAWEDHIYDDGDADLLVGLAAQYTGTPGEEMGSFESIYVDPLGVERRADLNLCLQPDRYGFPGGTAGRATPEWCTVDTTAGVTYLVAIRTISVPLDDNRLRFALALLEGECEDLGSVNECTLRGDADPQEGLDDVGGDLEAKLCGDEE